MLGRVSTRPELRHYGVVSEWNAAAERQLRRSYLAGDLRDFTKRLRSILERGKKPKRRKEK